MQPMLLSLAPLPPCSLSLNKYHNVKYHNVAEPASPCINLSSG